MSQLQTLQDLLVDLMKDTYDAELQLVEALPELAKAASNSQLKKAIRDHLAETKVHVSRLEEAFKHLDMAPRKKRCKAMAGLVKEGQDAGEEDGLKPLVDAGIISAAQKVEHYEISAYGTLRTYAQLLGLNELTSLFEATLAEEKAADAGLSGVAGGGLLSKYAKTAK